MMQDYILYKGIALLYKQPIFADEINFGIRPFFDAVGIKVFADTLKMLHFVVLMPLEHIKGVLPENPFTPLKSLMIVVCLLYEVKAPVCYAAGASSFKVDLNIKFN